MRPEFARKVVFSFAVAIIIVLSPQTSFGAESFSDSVGEFVQATWISIQTMPPFLYFTAMALLCVLPVPISPFYIAAGPLFGFETAFIWICGAIALNQLVAHRLAAGMLRPILQRFLARRGYTIPKPRTASEERILTAVIRMTPGPPYALQSWILGLADVELRRYLLISWPIQMAYAAAWLALGQSAFEGRTEAIGIAIGFIVALGLIARWASGRLKVVQERHTLSNEDSGS